MPSSIATSTFQPVVLESGIWRGEFYGKASGTLGSSVSSNRADSHISSTFYVVVPAKLTPPTSGDLHRSVVWIGAVSHEAQHTDIGSLSRDHDPRLLSLNLKVTSIQISAIISLLSERRLAEFHFEALKGDKNADALVIAGWSVVSATNSPLLSALTGSQ